MDEFLNFDLLACSRKFHQFWVGCIENHDSDFAEIFHSPSLSGQETAVSKFCSSNLSFRQNKPIKFKIFTFSPAWRNFTIFGYADLETTIQILSVFCPTILSFKQKKPIKFEILTFSPAQKKFIHFLGGWIGNYHWIAELLNCWTTIEQLNWKPKFRLCWNFS